MQPSVCFRRTMVELDLDSGARNISPRAEWRDVVHLFQRGKVVVLTGAGVSTDSGVPGYRNEEGVWMGAQPMQFADFAGSKLARQRYWARSYAGFTRMAEALPNQAHVVLAALERAGHVQLLVTQNVDRLHHRAGSQRVLELHGRLDRAVCLGCGAAMSRITLQQLLAELNPGWVAQIHVLRPDGDAEIGALDHSAFVVPDCSVCGGLLKPDVVFFGERVPAERHVQANVEIERASALLVVGSTLIVNSGYRLVRTAERFNVPVIVVNRGVTRADQSAALKLSGNAGVLLEALQHELSSA